ncbi:MAG TPA: cysteine desulfurase family protein [Acidimicrobiales bacterium]|nr:cysteine desulfurase family protein [Acidimicrobiales bacterium]
MSRHYLDHASTSPCRPEVVEAMVPWLAGEGAADPGRVHTEGRIARVAVEEARGRVADLLGTRTRQVIFTSGGTEAINAAVWGAVQAHPGGTVISTAVEHSAVRDASFRHAEIVEAGVDELGRIDVESFGAALDRASAAGRRAALAHCQLGNHEVSTLQPVSEVVAMCRERGVLVHVDAVAGAGHVPLDLTSLGADLVSVSGHKLGGPKGVGALVVGRGLRLDPLILGGEQERARRGGIENTPAIVGFGVAAELLADGRLEEERARASSQTDRVLDLARDLDGVTIYGDPAARLPHIACLGVAGVEAEAVLLGLDQEGIAVHSGSACSSESLAPSPVLEAMGADAERSLRVSVGWSTSDADIDALVAALPRVVDRLRALRV